MLGTKCFQFFVVSFETASDWGGYPVFTLEGKHIHSYSHRISQQIENIMLSLW